MKDLTPKLGCRARAIGGGVVRPLVEDLELAQKLVRLAVRHAGVSGVAAVQVGVGVVDVAFAVGTKNQAFSNSVGGG